MTAAPALQGDDRYCNARTRGGTDCRRPAGWGTDHPGAGPCKLHLGSTRNHRKAARLKLAERGAAASLAEVGYEPIDNPIEVLADLAAQANGFLQHCASMLADLESYRYSSEGGAEQLRAEVVLYERAMDRAARLVEALAKLGFEERRLELAEDDRRYFIDVLLVVVDGLFDLVDGKKVTAALAGRLRRDAVPALVERAIETTGRT